MKNRKKLFPCLVIIFLTAWISACVTIPLEIEYQSFSNSDYSSRSVPAKIVKGKLSDLLDSQYLLIGYLDVRRNIRKCYDDNTCKDISDVMPSESDILQQAADRGGDLVFILETRTITEKISKSVCTNMSYSTSVVNGIVQVIPTCSASRTINGLLDAKVSRALIWRKEPARATPEANAAAIEKALKTLEKVYAKTKVNKKTVISVRDKLVNHQPEKKITQERLKQIRLKAIQGDAASQFQMGLVYEYALAGLGKSYKKARIWYLKSAKQKNPRAMVQLGLMYFKGKGVKVKKAHAFKWMLRAANLGHANAQSNVCISYSAGLGVEKSKIQARSWCKKAYAQNDLTATAILGGLYLHGEGGAKDTEKGIRYITRAAEAGHAYAQYTLGKSYFLGMGVETNKLLAVRWLEKSVIQRNKYAQYMLAYMYEKGQGVRRNTRKALQLYKLAAAQGHQKALRRLGGYNDEGGSMGTLY